MQRVILLTLILLSAALPPGAAAAPDVTLEFWTISLQPFFTDHLNPMIATYERTAPGSRSRWVDVQFAAVEQKLLASLADGVAPDVVNLNTEMAIRLAEQGVLVDMDAAVPAAEKKRYFEGLWNSIRYRGRNYGLPWYVAPNVLAYNAGLYRKAGLDPLVPPASEDKVIAHAKAIKDKTNVYGVMPNADGRRMLHGFEENGLAILSADGKRAVFNTPAHVAYLAKYVQLLKRDYFPEDTLRRGFLGATERSRARPCGTLSPG